MTAGTSKRRDFDPPDTAAWGPIPSDEATFILLTDPDGPDLSEPGDSGGPFYRDHIAFGTMVGEFGVLRRVPFTQPPITSRFPSA